MKKHNRKKVEDFFGNNDTVYAKLDTDRHSANFYGFDRIISMSVQDVCQCIADGLHMGWEEKNFNHETGEYDYELLTEDEITDFILTNDLQFERPKID